MPVDPSELHTAIARIQKSYGKDSIRFANDDGNSSDILRVSTGSLELDYATNGGIPLNRFSRAWGSYHSGKSFMAWNVIKNAQKKGMVCAYYNVENQFDKQYVQRIGVNVDDLIIIDETIIEKIGTTMEALLGSVHIHVIDSATAAVSIEELNAKNIEDWQMGLRPRVWAKVFARINRQFNQDNAVIFIDQARDTFKFGGGEHPPGGRLMEHASSMTLHFKRGAWLYRDKDGMLQTEQEKQAKKKTMSKLTHPDGLEMVVRVEKSRAGPPLKTARVLYDFSKASFDLGFEYAKAALFTDIATGDRWITLPDGSKFNGITQLRREIMGREHRALRREIREALSHMDDDV